MSTSPVSRAFHEAVDRELMPLLARLGFARRKPEGVKPGLVVDRAERRLDAERGVEVTIWCDGGTGHDLRFRVDVVEPIQGVQCHRQIDLEVPWRDRAFARPVSLDRSGNELGPDETIERLAAAIAFLAGGFAANAERIAESVPELAGELRAAAQEPAWRAAVERAADLWHRRHVRGELDDRAIPAQVVFVGSQLLLLDCDGERHTFKLDTRGFDRAQPVSLAGWYRTPAGTRVATRLINGQKEWRFELDGSLRSALIR